MRIKQADNNIIQVVLGCNAERGQKFWTWTQAVPSQRDVCIYRELPQSLQSYKVYAHRVHARTENPTIFK